MSFNQYLASQVGMIRNDFAADLVLEKKQRAARKKDLYGNRRQHTTREHLDAVMTASRKMLKLDANETLLLARQLIYVMRQVHNVLHPGDILEQAMPINIEGGTGLHSVSYEVLDQTGKFKLIAGNASDLPEVGANMREVQQKVGTYAGYIGWSQTDSERSVRGNVNMVARKAQAAMMAARKTKNIVAWNGDPDGGAVQGLFDATLNPATISGTWASATNDDILDDLRALINLVQATTEDFRADTLVVDTASYAFLSGRLSNTDTTIAEFLLSKMGIRAILTTSYLNSITSTNNSLTADRVILAYPRDPMVLEFSLPRDTQQLPFQQQMLQFFAPLLLDTAGTLVYHDQAIAFATGM